MAAMLLSPPAKGVRRCLHGVVTGHKIMGMLDGRAEHEPGVGDGFEFNGLLGFLEHDGFAGRNLWRGRNRPLMGRDPDDTFAVGRFLVEGLPRQDQRECGNSRMGRKAEVRSVGRVGFEVIQKRERLYEMPNIAWADEPGHGVMRVSARAEHD